MDTPEKSAQISTPLSRFEDSPVFNYISSLSPIKPVRSIHIAQTFHSLSFSSLPSVFTSPHVSSHKESRFLRRNCYSDTSRLELSSGNGTIVCSYEGLVVGDLYDNSAELQGNFNNAVSIGEGSVEQSSEHLKYAIELPRTLKYDCSSPESEPTPCCGTQMDCAPELAGTSTSLDPFVEEVSQRISHEGEVNLPDTCQIEQKKDASECDWESLISDAADLLIFNSPIVTEGLKGLMQNSLDRAVGFCTSLNDMEKMQTINPISSVEQHEMKDPSTQPGETIVKQGAAANDNSQYEYMISNSSGQADSEVETSIAVDCKAVSNLHRGLRRRCLDFEMVGTRRKNSDNGSTSSSSTQVQLEGKIMSKDGQLVPVKPGSDSSKRILPGIGLHLNALAIASRDSKNLKHETAPSARTFPTTTASLPSPKTAQECNDSLALVPTKTEMDPTESDVLLDEDVSQASAHLVSDDLNPNSPKKKRRRVEGEIEGCKRCNCKKSKCLKLYCECFAAGVYCIEPCSCQECFNKPIHEDTVLATRKQIESRNPLAFAPKVIRNSESVPEIVDEPSKTPASARHKRGCNCKKSNCLKKYCECYQGGVGCSINCRCEGCKNAFGRKDGSAVMETEAEAEAEAEEGTEAPEKNRLDKISQKTEIPNNEEQNPNSTLPATPLQFCRSLVQMPFSSKSKPPRSFLSIGSSSALYTSQKYGKPNILRPTTTTTTTTRFEKQFQSVPDEDIPEVLRGDQSPSTVTKTSSPNGKRVSPHINLLGSSPGQRSSRKLILQSIPSFPSLTPQH